MDTYQLKVGAHVTPLIGVKAHPTYPFRSLRGGPSTPWKSPRSGPLILRNMLHRSSLELTANEGQKEPPKMWFHLGRVFSTEMFWQLTHWERHTMINHGKWQHDRMADGFKLCGVWTCMFIRLSMMFSGLFNHSFHHVGTSLFYLHQWIRWIEEVWQKQGITPIYTIQQ